MKECKTRGFQYNLSKKTEEILNNIQVDTSRDEILFIVNMKRAWEFTLDNINNEYIKGLRNRKGFYRFYIGVAKII